MKKLSLIAAIVTSTFLQACAMTQLQPEPELDTLNKKVSYIMGMHTARLWERRALEIDREIFDIAITDVISGAELRMTNEEVAEAFAEVRRVKARVQQIEKMNPSGESAKPAPADLENSRKFHAENGLKEGVITTASGLQYKVLVEGAGAKPTLTDTVTVHYRGNLIDGTIFDDSFKRGKPATFPVKEVIQGWSEALPLMAVGSRWKLYVPPKLAYGRDGAPGVLGPNETLIFEVELLSIDG
ncbi:MAG: FKBP-type peptidyl-prolyl cis-trans isomerase [Pseudomonadota bacterium]|nr:FKBP-type peptidyl-prolyl cis-trans isomerase [Pseudomonadota bacterium]MEC8104592.1 FKBP-type peptidyl-prolyl cis-trans isomerase [Pseudomonadota bacterium]MEC8524377.1 FKBP-type peptidyl-prolyl cis-trans isomerase [Pseudomonadota bacterium]